MPQRENNVAQATFEEVVERWGRPYADLWATLMVCGKCRRHMRPPRAKVEDWPETATRAVRGACARCYSHGYNPKLPWSPTQRSEGLSEADRMRVPAALPHGVEERAEMGAAAVVSTRGGIARNWDEMQHAVAWTVCCYVQDPAEAAEVMASLGLFDEDPHSYSSSYIPVTDLKGVAQNSNARKSHYS